MYLFLDLFQRSDVCGFGCIVKRVNFKRRSLKTFPFSLFTGEGYSKGTFNLMTDFGEKCQGTDVSFDITRISQLNVC